ncbi:MAG TPA: YXWGXW repeat-containing protein [Candidatus Acidoferrales bacterium]|nr:YXWGXW repeat-containing protein [Candidatus Acidoferrales bacterium]
MKTLVLMSTLAVGTILTGCAGRAYVAYGAPPPPRYGFVGTAPGPGYVWADGYWDRRGGQWAWVQGTWQRPPHPHAVWVAPAWRQEHGAWRFHKGYWRH